MITCKQTMKYVACLAKIIQTTIILFMKVFLDLQYIINLKCKSVHVNLKAKMNNPTKTHKKQFLKTKHPNKKQTKKMCVAAAF